MNGGQYRLTKQYVERRRTGNYCSGSQQRLAIKRHSKTTKFGNWTYFDVEMTGFFVLSMRITTILRRTATTRVAHGRSVHDIACPTDDIVRLNNVYPKSKAGGVDRRSSPGCD
jgi:hypothetical protein